jgi:hypothetical protein
MAALLPSSFSLHYKKKRKGDGNVVAVVFFTALPQKKKRDDNVATITISSTAKRKTKKKATSMVERELTFKAPVLGPTLVLWILWACFKYVFVAIPATTIPLPGHHITAKLTTAISSPTPTT